MWQLRTEPLRKTSKLWYVGRTIDTKIQFYMPEVDQEHVQNPYEGDGNRFIQRLEASNKILMADQTFIGFTESMS